MKFELLDHPADIGFRAYGQSKEELFANCALALMAIILDPSEIATHQEWQFEAEGIDEESLLVNWLNEVLYLVDSRQLAFCTFCVRFAGPNRVLCTALGEVRNPQKHPVRLAVKAVTYHQLRMSKTPEGWLAEVFVDV